MILFLPLVAAIVITLTPPSGLGLSIAWQRGDAAISQSLAALHPPAWKNWLWDYAGDPGYVPQVYSMRKWDEAAAQRARDRGGIWILGSEPELSGTYTEPAIAAAFSRRWAAEVGGEWGAPGIITWPAGYAWLNEYMAAGGAVGTHWHIHVYDVSTADDWALRWHDWRAWMKANGAVRPTIVSETAGWDATVDQAAILDRIAAIQADDPLLAVVLWYSDRDWWRLWTWADLLDDGGLTALGRHYVSAAWSR